MVGNNCWATIVASSAKQASAKQASAYFFYTFLKVIKIAHVTPRLCALLEFRLYHRLRNKLRRTWFLPVVRGGRTPWTRTTRDDRELIIGRRPLGCLNTAAAGSAQPCSTCRSPSRPPTEARSTPAPPPAKAAPPSPASRRAATRNLHAQKLAHRPPPLAAAPPAPRRPSSRTRPPPARVPLPPLLSSTLPLARRRSSSHPCFMRLAGRGRHRRSSPVAAAAAVAAA